MPRPPESARNQPLPPHDLGDGRTPAGLERLRRHIRRLEGFGGTLAGANRRILPFGIDEIDGRLPDGGIVRGALHEIFAADAGIATAFCALLAGRLSGHRNVAVTEMGTGMEMKTGAETGSGAILWCERPRTLDAGALYGPALRQFGIDPARLILVRARRDADVLWAMEEGLRCARLAVVVGEAQTISLTASRRLQLAAGESGVTALALRPASDRPPPSAALTRWRLAAAGRGDGDKSERDDNRLSQSAPPGLRAARWQVDLFRCRGGTPANWMMEWSDETGDFSVAALVRDRPAVPSAAGLAG